MAAALVVGGGVVGLTTAAVLAEDGFQVELVARALPEFGDGARELCTEGACALWLPIFIETPLELSLTELARRSKERFWAIDYDEAGLLPVVNHELLASDDLDAGLAAGLQLLGGNRIDSLGHPIVLESSDPNDPPVEYDRVWTCETLVVEMPSYISWLAKYVVDLGVTCVSSGIGGLPDLSARNADVVVNCLGLSSPNVFGADERLNPKKGHLIRLPPVDSRQSLGAGEYCLIPRRDALIAGSLTIPTADRQPKILDRERIIRNLAAFGPIIGDLGYAFESIPFEVGKDITALRPYRTGGPRCESERMGEVVVIHNYGHGGAGVTLSWGYAQRVAELAAAICA
jgi:D-amino-acid oxidase